MQDVKDIPVCIIIPPSPFLADERVFPFLGPLKVAASLRANGNHVEVLDLSGYSNYIKIVEDYMDTTDISHFGITATTPQLPATSQIVDVIHSYRRANELGYPRVMLGGPHATMVHTAYEEDKKVKREGRGTQAFYEMEHLSDQLISGDGEKAILHALANPDSKFIDASNLKSDLFLKRGTLDQHPFPARDLIDLGSYRYEIDGKRAFSVIAQLGCPFECGFCGGRASQAFRLARPRAMANVLEEIESVLDTYPDHEYGAVMFYDDELNILPRSLEELCKGLISLQERRGLEMRFRGFVKAELFTQEQAHLMKEAGFRVILSGVESGSLEMLTAMRKKTTPAINAQCVEYTHAAGMTFKSLMSLGHPGENRKTVRESVMWANQNLKQGDEIDWTVITQYPGSPYFDRSISENGHWTYVAPDTKEKLFSTTPDFTQTAEYYKGIPGEYVAYVWTDYLSPEELVEQRDWAESVTRERLRLPDIAVEPAISFEHSMGQSLPRDILRTSG
jgi:anaerobic magnesium-protoporphyrin IX monomethyl ester cyclase